MPEDTFLHGVAHTEVESLSLSLSLSHSVLKRKWELKIFKGDYSVELDCFLLSANGFRLKGKMPPNP